MNSFLYAYVALVMQASQAHNVPIPGGRKYSVPSGNITIDDTVDTFYPNISKRDINLFSHLPNVTDFVV